MIHKKYYLYPRYEKKINFIIMLHACEINWIIVYNLHTIRFDGINEEYDNLGKYILF